jgi:peptidoglycan/LPS O-acetylase OafA/YrhL
MAVDGKAAVIMFFVLSGFVLSRPYFHAEPGQPPRQMDVPVFYFRRFARIWLPWLAIFCVSALAQVKLYHFWQTSPGLNGWYDRFWHQSLTWKNFFRQCLFLQHDARVQLLPQDWSLGVELKASILLPILIYCARRLTSWSLVGISGLLLCSFAEGHCYTAFILGILLAQQGDDIVNWLKARPFPLKIGLFIMGLTLYEADHCLSNPLKADKYLLLLTALGCVLILLASMSSRRIQAALHLRPIVFLGKISYSVYLIQFIIILCLLPPWIHILNLAGIEQTCWLLPLSLIGSVGMTVGLACLSYQYIEIPGIKLGQWFSRKKTARRPIKPAKPA